MAIRYKVVTKDKRESCTNIHIKLPKGFSRTYLKNTYVTAPKASIGLCCFKRRMHAEWFMSDFAPKKLQILRVQTTQRGSVPKSIYPVWRGTKTSTVLRKWFEQYIENNKNDVSTLDVPFTPVALIAPLGTICYPKVYVLD